MKTTVTKAIGPTVHKITHKALQAGAVTQLKAVAEVHVALSRSNLRRLQLDALIVDNLDIDILAGTPS